MDESKFQEAAKRFLQLSIKLGDSWQLNTHNIHPMASVQSSIFLSRQSEFYSSASNQLFIFKHHILYSPTYRVPTIYFRIYESNSARLIFNLPPELCQADSGLMNVFVSIAEHPLMGDPWLHLHPCQTEQVMNELGVEMCDDSGMFLVKWLSVFGRLVGCNIGLNYYE